MQTVALSGIGSSHVCIKSLCGTCAACMVLKMRMAVWVAPPLTAASSSALATPGATTWLAAASTCRQEHTMHLPSMQVPRLLCEVPTVTIHLPAT